MNLRPQPLQELRDFILDDYLLNKFKVRGGRGREGGREGGEGGTEGG